MNHFTIRPHSESIERLILSDHTSARVTVHTMDMNCYIHSMNCTPVVVCSDKVCLSIDSECDLNRKDLCVKFMN